MTIVKLSSYIALAVAAAGALSPDQAMPGATAIDEPRLLLEVNEGGSTLPGDPGAPAYRQGQADIRGGYPSYATGALRARTLRSATQSPSPGAPRPNY